MATYEIFKVRNINDLIEHLSMLYKGKKKIAKLTLKLYAEPQKVYTNMKCDELCSTLLKLGGRHEIAGFRIEE